MSEPDTKGKKNLIAGETFGSRLKKLRTESGMSMALLGRLIHLDEGRLSRLESGMGGNPSFATLDRICGFYGVTRAWLLDGEGEQFAKLDAEDARRRYEAAEAAASERGNEDEFREEKLLSDITLRLRQIKHGSRAAFEKYRQQIIHFLDDYFEFCESHYAEVRMERLKLGRALAEKNVVDATTSMDYLTPMQISERLKQKRGKLGLTQNEAAKRWGVPVATLRNWEQGIRKPRGLALKQLELILRSAPVD